jgi:serine phosphatase RsbU (regulator of sigma subunit)
LETKLGVVIVKKREKDFFSRFDYNIMKNLALYISLALQNADVFGQLQQQKEKIEKQGKKIHLQNEQIKSSIQQAHTMQSAFLPTHLQLSKAYNYFLVYRPKDIVSGDFYWHKKYDDTKEKPETLYYAVSDCTGHGVPGALMALIGANLMEQFIVQEQIHPLSKVLEMLDFKVRDVLKQKDTENKDGMDVVLCKIEKTSDTTRKVHFASAKRPLYYFDSKAKEVKTLKGTRRSIGGTAKISKELFVDEILHLHKGDILYLTTDGYVDQNNQDRKRFGTTNFINLLNQIATEDLENQQIIIELAIEKYMQNEEQRDDITILGIQL